MSILKVYFPDTDTPRILNTELHADNHVWIVGRGTRTETEYPHKIFIDPRFIKTSTEHGCIRYSEEDEVWQYKDWKVSKGGGSTNGTYFRKRGDTLSSNDAIPPGVWRTIFDGDYLFLGDPKSYLLFRYSHDTLKFLLDEDPTQNKTIQEAMEAHQKALPSPETLSQVKGGPESIAIDNKWAFLSSLLTGIPWWGKFILLVILAIVAVVWLLAH